MTCARRKPRRLVFVALGVLTLVSCGGGDAAHDPPAPATAPASAAAPVPDTRPRVVCLGDSLTAGYGLSPEQAYPALVAARISSRGLPFAVVNAGVSGDTSAGGLGRLDWALDGDVRVVIVALGGNDGLRGLPPDQLRANLARIVERSRAKGARVLLLGMEAPPNLGPAYAQAFRAVYRDVAREYDLALVPFFLAGVAGVPSLNQADGIHPNADGHRRVAETVWRALEPMLEGARTIP